MKEVTCNKCGWVHMAVSRHTMLINGIDNNTCYNCGNSYTDFRDALESDALIGVTLQPILEYDPITVGDLKND